MNYSDINVSGYETLLLDRDGVINKLRPNDYVKDWSEFEFNTQFLDVISAWTQKFKHIFIVTNQRGVGKGLMTEKNLQDIHQKMVFEIEKNGGRIDDIFYCTALSDSDVRRKPNIGMFLEIQDKYNDINPEKCLMIGDSNSDRLFAENCGISFQKI